MLFRRTGFTLVELMIVVAIIALLAGVLFPQMTIYYARGRDVQRLSDIKAMSSKFQDYNRVYGVYPSNTNILAVTSYCISDIRTWSDAISGVKDRQFSQLGGSGTLHSDPKVVNPSIGVCANPGSYFYAQLLSNISYGVLAARMERQTTGANYNTPSRLHLPGFIDEMIKATPLDKSLDETDKIYLMITN